MNNEESYQEVSNYITVKIPPERCGGTDAAEVVSSQGCDEETVMAGLICAFSRMFVRQSGFSADYASKLQTALVRTMSRFTAEVNLTSATGDGKLAKRMLNMADAILDEEGPDINVDQAASAIVTAAFDMDEEDAEVQEYLLDNISIFTSLEDIEENDCGDSVTVIIPRGKKINLLVELPDETEEEDEKEYPDPEENNQGSMGELPNAWVDCQDFLNKLFGDDT